MQGWEIKWTQTANYCNVHKQVKSNQQEKETTADSLSVLVNCELSGYTVYAPAAGMTALFRCRNNAYDISHSSTGFYWRMYHLITISAHTVLLGKKDKEERSNLSVKHCLWFICHRQWLYHRFLTPYMTFIFILTPSSPNTAAWSVCPELQTIMHYLSLEHHMHISKYT